MRGKRKIGADINNTVESVGTQLLALSGLNKIPRVEPSAIHWQLSEKSHTYHLLACSWLLQPSYSVGCQTASAG